MHDVMRRDHRPAGQHPYLPAATSDEDHGVDALGTPPFVRLAGGVVLGAGVLAAPAVALAALTTSIFALDPCKKTADARAQLRAQGFDLGA